MRKRRYREERMKNDASQTAAQLQRSSMLLCILVAHDGNVCIHACDYQRYPRKEIYVSFICEQNTQDCGVMQH